MALTVPCISGRPVISKDLQRLIDETMQEIQLSEGGADNVKFATMPVPLPKYYGSGQLFPAYAILPDYVNVNGISDLKSTTLNEYLNTLYMWRVENPDQWMSSVGKLLVDSFVLSDKAKKFLIARQAFMADNNSIGMFTCIVMVCTYLFYFLVEALYNAMVRRGHEGFWNMLSIGCVSAGLTFGNFYISRYTYAKRLDKDADAKALSKGMYNAEQYEEARKKGQPLPVDPDYYEGAIEYYSKEIQRNRSLRVLTKKSAGWFEDPSRLFTEDGDYRKNIFSTDPYSSRSIKRIIAWKLGSQMVDD